MFRLCAFCQALQPLAPFCLLADGPLCTKRSPLGGGDQLLLQRGYMVDVTSASRPPIPGLRGHPLGCTRIRACLHTVRVFALRLCVCVVSFVFVRVCVCVFVCVVSFGSSVFCCALCYSTYCMALAPAPTGHTCSTHVQLVAC